MAVNNRLANREAPKQVALSAYLTQDAVKNHINKVIGGENGTRFISAVVSATQTNPQLQECTNQSVLTAALQGEALNLPPSPQLGYYYLVPFKNRKKNCTEAQFQLSAKGYKQLAMRSGQYKDIDVLYIHEGEYLGRDKTTGKYKFEFIEDDDERESRPVVGYLAYFELLNGFRKQMYWTKAKMEKHADRYSQAFSLEAAKKLQEGKIPQSETWKYSSFWYANFDEMAEKTMIRQLLSKWGLLSIQMQQAYIADMAVINEDGTRSYVDTEEYQMPDAEPVQEDETEPEPAEKVEVVEAEVVEMADVEMDAQTALFGK